MADQIFDKGYKRILSKKKNFLTLLKNFIQESWVEDLKEEDIELIDKEFIPKDFKEKEADVIYKLKVGGQEVIFYFLLELQSYVDYTMSFRLLIYMTELYKRIFMDTEEKIRERSDFRLPAIIPCVLYNGEHSWTAVQSFKEYLNGHERFGNHVIDFQYILLNVNQYTDEDLYEIGNLISDIFTLDQKQDSEQLKANMNRIGQTLSRLSQEEQIDLTDWLRDVLIKKLKEGKEGFVNQAIESWKKGDVKVMTYGIERLFDEIEEKARTEGRTEGIERGIGRGIEMIAIKMMQKGKSIEEIQEVTDLAYEKIMNLRKVASAQ